MESVCVGKDVEVVVVYGTEELCEALGTKKLWDGIVSGIKELWEVCQGQRKRLLSGPVLLVWVVSAGEGLWKR